MLEEKHRHSEHNQHTFGIQAFDMIAEVLPRAPEWMQRTGLEWVWRLILEPKRFNRIYRAVIAFPITVAWDSIKAGRILQALPSVFKEVFTQLKK